MGAGPPRQTLLPQPRAPSSVTRATDLSSLCHKTLRKFPRSPGRRERGCLIQPIYLQSLRWISLSGASSPLLGKAGQFPCLGGRGRSHIDAALVRAPRRRRVFPPPFHASLLT